MLGRSAPGPPLHPLLTMPDLACLMPMPGGAAWSLPATLGQPHWHSEPGEPLTALALLAEEMHPACLEMSGWWGTGTALTPSPPTTAWCWKQALAPAMEPGQHCQAGKGSLGVLLPLRRGRGDQPPVGMLIDERLSRLVLQP